MIDPEKNFTIEPENSFGRSRINTMVDPKKNSPVNPGKMSWSIQKKFHGTSKN